jgi:hypothetical protein
VIISPSAGTADRAKLASPRDLEVTHRGAVEPFEGPDGCPVGEALAQPLIRRAPTPAGELVLEGVCELVRQEQRPVRPLHGAQCGIIDQHSAVAANRNHRSRGRPGESRRVSALHECSLERSAARVERVGDRKNPESEIASKNGVD